MINLNTPPVPKKNKYGFNEIEIGGYKKLLLDNEMLAMKARTAALTHASLNNKKFVTKVKGSVLEVWRIEKPVAIDPFFG